MAHLWQEFVLEMRFRWENNFLIPGLASGSPDLRCCLLHQKLQMLNCCIERKKARDEGKRRASRIVRLVHIQGMLGKLEASWAWTISEIQRRKREK